MEHFNYQLSLRKKKENFPITMTDLFESRQNFKLTLRKSRLENFLNSKRFSSIPITQSLSSLVDSIPSINNNKALLYQNIDTISKIILKVNKNSDDEYSKELTDDLLVKMINFINDELVHYINEIDMCVSIII